MPVEKLTRDGKTIRIDSFSTVPLTIVILAALGYAALWGEYSGLDYAIPQYIILHTVMEMAAIVVAMLGAGIVWNAYASERPGHLVLLRVLLFGTALLDFAHMLSVPGMPVMVTPADVQKSITFWLAARTLPAIGLCIAALGFNEPLKNPRSRFVMAAGVLLYVALVYWVTLFHMDRLPTFYQPLQGLTPYKVGYEYLLVATYGFAALWMLRNLRHNCQSTLPHLFVASAIAAISELCFTLYHSHGDLFNLVGHFYKIVCYAFIYRAVFASSVRQPFEALHAALGNEKRLAEQNLSVVRTLDLLEEAVLELDTDGCVINANAGWRSIVGDDGLPNRQLLAHVHPEDRSGFELQFNALVSETKDEFHGRFRVGMPDKPDKWFDCRFVAVREAGNDSTSVRGVMHDITKVYLQERHIHHMALHDTLTSLPNRVLLEDRIQQAIQQANRANHRIAVCFVDLDHFKDINDAYGHKVGDELLLAIAHRLRDCLREGDTLARWGGDEFVALLQNLSEPGSERQVAQKMIAVAHEPLDIAGIALSSSFSMGIAVYPDDEPSGNIDALLAQADRAMFYAKSQGRNNFQFYSDIGSKGSGKKDLYVQVKLARAIHEGQITAWFQPLVSARSVLEGRPRMEGVEVLARWHDNELGWVSPGSFITMAESLGLIGELGTQVRRTGFAALRDWQATMPNLKMSINVSKRQLFSVNFIGDLLADLRNFGLHPQVIHLEITESVALADVDYADERLRTLAKAGFKLSIDDFGTGYASLSQLHDLPVSELKIDMSFVRRLHTDEGRRMVQGIMGLAGALRLTTVAEGVEDEQTARILGEMGVNLLQGYHFARPCSREDFVCLPLFSCSP